jgi:rhodanese-related sulfurtransferase
MTSQVLFAIAAMSAVDAARLEQPIQFISTDQLSAQVAAAPPARWKFSIVDARSRVEYEESHIAGAISVPLGRVAALLPKRVKDKHRELVFYCNGPRCTKSQKAARAALALGYTTVLEYNEGLPAWGKAKLPIEGSPLPVFEAGVVSPEQLASDLKTGRAPRLMVDVRDPEEFRAFHLKDAVNIPLDELERRARELPAAADLLLTCQMGQQSIVGARLLHHLGFTRVERLDGGIVAWQQKGLPTESNAAAPLQ